MYFLENTTNNPVVAYVVWGAFGALILWLIISEIVGKAKFKNADHTINPDWLQESFYDDGSNEMKEYFFHYYGKMNQSFLVEDKDGHAVFEANKRYMSFLSPEEYDFINHVSEVKSVHTCSKTQSTSYGMNGVSVRTSSYFKFDGEVIWEYLRGRGFTHEIQIQGLLKMNINVFKDGKQIAHLENTGAKPLQGGGIPARGYYKINCYDKDLDAAVLYAITFSLTEYSRQYTNY